MLRQYFSCNEILEIFLTSFWNILSYVGKYAIVISEYFSLHEKTFSNSITFWVRWLLKLILKDIEFLKVFLIKINYI